MKRLFIGLPITCENAVKIVNNWQTNTGLNRLVWTKPSNWHITLVFLGTYAESAIPQINLIIEEAFKDFKAYTSYLRGVGIFPDHRKPNVVWIGLNTKQILNYGYDNLIGLLKQNNFIFDQKPFKPHLTVARIKYLPDHDFLNELLVKYKDFNFGQVVIDRIILYESVSTVNGVMYIPLYVKKVEFST